MSCYGSSTIIITCIYRTYHIWSVCGINRVSGLAHSPMMQICVSLGQLSRKWAFYRARPMSSMNTSLPQSYGSYGDDRLPAHCTLIPTGSCTTNKHCLWVVQLLCRVLLWTGNCVLSISPDTQISYYIILVPWGLSCHI